LSFGGVGFFLTGKKFKHIADFQFEYRGNIVAKNKGDMAMWFVERG